MTILVHTSNIITDTNDIGQQVFILTLDTFPPYSQKKAHHLEFHQRSIRFQTVTISWFKTKVMLLWDCAPPIFRTLSLMNDLASYFLSRISSRVENR